MGFIYGMFEIVLRCYSRCTNDQGTVTIFQYGAGTAGVMRTLGKYMAASGGMFAYVSVPYSGPIQLTTYRVFMGVGSIIRHDSEFRAAELWAQHRRKQAPFVHPRRDLPYLTR